MALFETGTITDVVDLLAKVKVFAEANGYTVNKYITGPLVYDNTFAVELYLKHTATSRYHAFGLHGQQLNNYREGVSVGTTDTGRIILYNPTGYDGGLALSAQPGSPWGQDIWQCESAFATSNYWLFTNSGGDYIHVVWESTSQRFHHFIIGELDKAGAYTGGEYNAGVRWYDISNYYQEEDINQHCMLLDKGLFYTGRGGSVRAEVDSKIWRRSATQQADTDEAFGFPRTGENSGVRMPPSTLNGSVVLTPYEIFIIRTGGDRTYIGRIKDARLLRMDNLNPADILTIGSDSWYVFPFVRKVFTGISLSHSGNYAIAYKKNL